MNEIGAYPFLFKIRPPQLISPLKSFFCTCYAYLVIYFRGLLYLVYNNGERYHRRRTSDLTVTYFVSISCLKTWHILSLWDRPSVVTWKA